MALGREVYAHIYIYILHVRIGNTKSALALHQLLLVVITKYAMLPSRSQNSLKLVHCSSTTSDGLSECTDSPQRLEGSQDPQTFEPLHAR